MKNLIKKYKKKNQDLGDKNLILEMMVAFASEIHSNFPALCDLEIAELLGDAADEFESRNRIEVEMSEN